MMHGFSTKELNASGPAPVVAQRSMNVWLGGLYLLLLAGKQIQRTLYLPLLAGKQIQPTLQPPTGDLLAQHLLLLYPHLLTTFVHLVDSRYVSVLLSTVIVLGRPVVSENLAITFERVVQIECSLLQFYEAR